MDLLRFNASHQFRNWACQIFFVAIAVAAAHSVYSIAIQYNEFRIALFIAVLAFFISYILIWLFQLLFNVFFLYSKKNRSVLTNHIVELQEEALFEETPYNRSYFYWNGIEKIKNISGYLAIYVTAHSAVIIPNRAFENTERKKDFLKLLNKYYFNA